jgi:hypothetical protein
LLIALSHWRSSGPTCHDFKVDIFGDGHPLFDILQHFALFQLFKMRAFISRALAVSGLLSSVTASYEQIIKPKVFIISML